MRLPSASSPSSPPEAAPRHAAVYIVVGVSDPAPYCVLLQNPSLSLSSGPCCAGPGPGPPWLLFPPITHPTHHLRSRPLPSSMFLVVVLGVGGGGRGPVIHRPSADGHFPELLPTRCTRAGLGTRGWGTLGRGQSPWTLHPAELASCPVDPKASRCLPARLHLPQPTLPAQPSRESTPLYPHSTAPQPCPHAHVAASICPCDRDPLRCRRAQGTNSPSRRCLSHCFCQRLPLLCYRAGGLPQMADRQTDSRLCASNTQWSEIPTSSPTIFQLTARFKKETSIFFL